MKRKNDYTCIAFFEGMKPKKWVYVHKLKGFFRFLNQRHQGWKYVNVYNRRTKEYLKRFYPSDSVPDFLGAVLLLWFSYALGGPLNSTFNKAVGAVPLPLYGFNNTATISTLVVQKGGGHGGN